MTSSAGAGPSGKSISGFLSLATTITVVGHTGLVDKDRDILDQVNKLVAEEQELRSKAAAPRHRRDRGTPAAALPSRFSSTSVGICFGNGGRCARRVRTRIRLGCAPATRSRAIWADVIRVTASRATSTSSSSVAVTTAWSRRPTSPGPDVGFGCSNVSNTLVEQQFRRMPSTASTPGCRGTRIWSACLPRRIVDDLGARVRLARRRYSSYTPDPATGGHTGLLVGPGGSFDAVGAGARPRPASTSSTGAAAW